MAARTKTTAIRGAGEIWELAQNGTMRLPRFGSATIVRVERGTVLVTQEGDLEDHVLEPGDERVLKAGPRAVAWAFTEAVITVREGVIDRLEDRPAAPPSGGRARELIRRVLEGGRFHAPREEPNDDGPHAPDRRAA